MSARDDYRALYNMSMYEADSLGQYNRALDEIDSLRDEVDRLVNDIDGHRQFYVCRPERQEP